ncbi:helix-turn-helix domain-containing protein [Streptomyces phyllanthi]|uniref:Helix-turn-helix domain-containing protein n=1 Tax=Streptomyces phyllanthi TaxID=1803180 RepID=A0A5N8W2N6_9ACTN|nr:helix-turn-helix transcriptional regulator [Streptomyces phyllanthi]MPY41382.1 helix-turn-helix domain-containing protein [Streptomyces phyllanthi]
MGLRANPTYRQRRFGAEVRGIRERAGFTAARAAEAMGMNASHISTVESGRTGLSADRLHRLASASGGEQATYVEGLVELGQASGKGWWTEYREQLRPSLLDLAELEDRAERIVCYEPMFIPGLFQTLAYATAGYRGGYALTSPEQQEREVDFRMQRQCVLTGERPPRIHAVIHEAALHVSWGSPEIMRDQLLRLIEMARLPHVTLQVLPFDGRVGFGTSFTLLEPAVPQLSTVVVEHVEKALYLGESEALARYRNWFARLCEAALPPVAVEAGTGAFLAKNSLGLVQRLLYPLL